VLLSAATFQSQATEQFDLFAFLLFKWIILEASNTVRTAT
jgi:hypothetical protein